MKVAGYIRVSSDREEQQTSIANQKDLIRNFIKDNNLDFHDFYEDIMTGTSEKRDGLIQLIKDAENNKFDVIIAKELSRLGRNVELLYKLKRIAETQGIRLITLDGKVDTQDPAKLAMFGLYAWIFESESQRISDRIKSVFEVKKKQGQRLGGYAPYGYRQEQNKLYVCDDDTPELVREIYNKFLSGLNINQIARYLNDRGIPTPTKKPFWSDNTIKWILKNPVYVGDVISNKQTTINVTTKKCKKIPKGDWIVVRDVHEPIISREIFEQVNSILESRRKQGRGKMKPANRLFTNFLYCADCGKGMWYRHTRLKGKPRYICGGYSRFGTIACSSHSIPEHDISEAILNDLRLLSNKLDNSSFEKKLEKQASTKRNKVFSRLKQVEIHIKKQIDLKQNALEKFISNEISKDDYDSFVNRVQEKVSQLEWEKEVLTETKSQFSNDESTVLKKQLDKYTGFETLTREMLNWFVEKIEVTESKELKITYKFSQFEGL